MAGTRQGDGEGAVGRPRTSLLVTVAVCLIAAGGLSRASSAGAQEYGESSGSLAITSRVSLEVSGVGFMADSEAKMVLTLGDVRIDLGSLPIDASGGLAGALALPDGLEPGTYLLSATGVTPDGSTLVLSADVAIGTGEALEEPTPSSGGAPTPLVFLTIVLGLALVTTSLGWWRASRARGPE